MNSPELGLSELHDRRIYRSWNSRLS